MEPRRCDDSVAEVWPRHGRGMCISASSRLPLAASSTPSTRPLQAREAGPAATWRARGRRRRGGRRAATPAPTPRTGRASPAGAEARSGSPEAAAGCPTPPRPRQAALPLARRAAPARRPRAGRGGRRSGRRRPPRSRLPPLAGAPASGAAAPAAAARRSARGRGRRGSAAGPGRRSPPSARGRAPPRAAGRRRAKRRQARSWAAGKRFLHNLSHSTLARQTRARTGADWHTHRSEKKERILHEKERNLRADAS